MARARKSHKSGEEEVKIKKGSIQPPYDHRPGRNRYVIYCDYYREDLETPKVLILGFAELYSAKFFLSLLVNDEEYVWIDPIGMRECIKTRSGVRISTEPGDLKKILGYSPTEQELEWEDDQVRKYVSRFKFGRDPISHRAGAESADDAEPIAGKSRSKKDTREPKEPKVKIDKTGMVTANDIAKELGVEGREVRGVLRALKLEKPQGGWAFDKKTADEIREKVKKGLKEAKEKKGKKK